MIVPCCEPVWDYLNKPAEELDRSNIAQTFVWDKSEYSLDESAATQYLFDDSGTKLLGNIYSVQLSKSDFDGLTKGQSIEEVKTIDPNGEYLFLYTGRNDTPKVSSHYTKDGYLITIEYDDFNTIISINEELI